MDHPIPDHLVEGPEAWLSADLDADPTWIRTLGDEERAELRSAVESHKTRGLAAFEGERADFPLPTLGSLIAEIVASLEHGRGVMLLRGLDVDSYELEDMTRLYWGLGMHLGRPIPQNARGDLIGSVQATPGRSIVENNVRGYATNDRLPPHNDPSDAVGLLCIRPARSGGRTVFCSAVAIFNEIRRTNPEYLPYLFRGFHFDLRGEGVTSDPDEVTMHPVPVFSWHAGRLSCRFNRRTIVGGQIKAGKPITGEELASVDRVAELVLDPRFHHAMFFEPGDLQLLCNHSILHYREEFEDGGAEDERRHLLRIWINLDEDKARPLETRFASRHNTGPRGGIMVHDRHTGWVP